MPAHCQICERRIKLVHIPHAALGQGNVTLARIAHHGFKRPGQGWQTSSCFGAKYEPYETNSDAIPIAITAISNWRDMQKTALHALLTNPPAGLPYETGARYGVKGRECTALRPLGFTPLYASKGTRYEPHTYGVLFDIRKRKHEADIESANQDIKRLQKRLHDWRPEAEAATA